MRNVPKFCLYGPIDGTYAPILEIYVPNFKIYAPLGREYFRSPWNLIPRKFTPYREVIASDMHPNLKNMCQQDEICARVLVI